MDTDRIPDFNAENGERSAQIINVELGKGLAVVSICSALCALAASLSLWAAYTASVATTEYRVAINHSMEMEAKQEVLIKEVEALKHGH